MAESENITKEGTSRFGKAIKLLIVFIILAGMISATLSYLRYQKTHVKTDDAFIEGSIYYVSSQIPGKVFEKTVSSNQLVVKDQILVRIDTTDIRADLRSARENLDVVSNQVAGQEAALEVVDAQIKMFKTQLKLVSKEKQRISNLLDREAVSPDDYDKISTQWESLNAQIDTAQKQHEQIQAMIGETDYSGKEAPIRLAEAQIAKIKLQLDHAVIRAPVSGYITRSNVEAGQVISAGQPLMAVVPLDDLFILANYKETDLTYVRTGQMVAFEVDTYKGVKFYGYVDSIMAGTGSVFSLLPPENATGNYVKVVQRVPLKIRMFNVDTQKHPMRLGMSVVPTILVNEMPEGLTRSFSENAREDLKIKYREKYPTGIFNRVFGALKKRFSKQ